MSGVFLMLFVVFCPLILSESGDDDVLDDEDVTCSSNLTLKQSSLSCSLSGEPSEEVRLTLCMSHQTVCTNAIKGPQDFTFPNLTILATYDLRIEPGEYVKTNLKLPKLVKIPAPQILLATYIEDAEEGFLSIQHNHDYVKNPLFQVKIFSESTVPILDFNTKLQNITISRDKLGGVGVYNILVRAKPEGYFEGMWSEWSSKASFTIKTPGKTRNIDPPIVIEILIIFSVFLLLIICLGTWTWKTNIKNCMKPNIPHPKTTLAQIQRGREGFPFIFSPEIFRDTFIHRVDYVDEKPTAEEFQEGLDERRYSRVSSKDSLSTSVCEMDTNVAELLPREQSHLKIGLSSESDFPEERKCVSEGVTTLQRECKDEAYVTMSSLFKTQ
ncbi:interleukin-7 receptor subunit alpha [Triplophysa dalaica]|uniref:interleukin-7 receptor subunit alpha n=1 Tax=Triplophysa dalaica TaxID=1582913 RepID=UPI0024E01C84|nr:interleukin-7 receptor subunit alpha [Triplophysa dalaica]XP_056587778.1 interleukin-7 receptor subunit alpha [Triplophysa dalaica]XP_056587779.1 interleukin-7 receptor subunit alpha [Triplophysa dalaica]